MITVGVIRNGATYLSQHLNKNDYWTEGEKEVQGEWIGHGATLLGLEGGVQEKPFEALRRNRDPRTGKRLTAREDTQRVAFFDVQLSAPKDVSVLAMLGNDERIDAAFREAVKIALEEMERFAAVRERRGDARASEAFRLTGNFAGALFFHNTSRDLDPQLHAHAVFANATWDAERGGWYALQPAEMLRASGYLRQVLYRELAARLRGLGYEPYDMNANGFSIRGVEHLRERFSKRTRRVQQLADEFAQKKGRRPTNSELRILVRESRADKLTNVSTAEVRARQRAELSGEEAQALAGLVTAARGRAPRRQWSQGQTLAVLEAALRHVYERSSVVREGEILNAALDLHPDFYRWRELRQALEQHPEAIRRDGEMSLRPIRLEEAATVRRVMEGRNTRFPLGTASHLPERLTRGQLAAARALLASKDFVSVLIGDAGTGKTTVLSAIEAAHRQAGGQPFLPLAPTTRAREALVSAGFEHADTVQRFLVSEVLQAQSARRVVLVDEAGLLSTQQLDGLTRLAGEQRARLLLVGDTKQHYSVQRGDALRNVIKHSGVPVVRLSEVLRQRGETDRQFSRMLASGEVMEAFHYAARRGLIRELGDDEALFTQAAEHYASNLAQRVETLVVIPFWDEIERFNVHARAALRRRGLLGEVEVVREAVKPVGWSEEQKTHWDQYRIGDRLLFVRDTRFFKRGTAAEVTAILPDGLQVTGAKGRFAKITRKQRGTFDVGRPQMLPVAVGDRLLIRGREDDQEFANGDFKDVAQVDPVKNEILLTDGTKLPAEFRAWTYGHALTSYRSQGSTAEESLLVLGEVAERALMRRQFYVGNTRYRGAHRIYVSHREAILNRLAHSDSGRELATEFIQRHRLTRAEQIAMRPLWRMGDRVRHIWRSVRAHVEELREAMHERREI
ncbi:MobF family relaxase [Opitutus terrae]|uniref:Conjugative relaxase domain protein n=1 Tax=Opitutus terrae (strain DSM 11246 / JCM 15787 / PB90-1) TaxID=452637 RepID=B1ZPG2_OPITP|nr:MobF family relaxase [Opitutus terrae]ACB74481.1 conjugative relaxase domain protein [Opitutus terrae PB90-1]